MLDRRCVLLVVMVGVGVLVPGASSAGGQLPAAPPPVGDTDIVDWWRGTRRPGAMTVNDWPWGEQFFDQNTSTSLELTNECYVTQVVTISVHTSLAPLIDIPRSVTVPARSTKSVPVTILAPPAPDPMPIPPPTGGPWDIHMDLEDYAMILVIQGSGAPPGASFGCVRSLNQIHRATGHFHVDPTATPVYHGPSLTPCDVWWFSGRKPPTFDDDCAGRFWQLLDHYREVTLRVLMADDPDAWAWFPTGSLLAGMSAEEILAVRQRAEAQIAAGGEEGQ